MTTVFDLITSTANKYSLDPAIVLALCRVESALDPDAWNPEPKYRYFWDVSKNAPFRLLQHGEIQAKTPPPDFPCLKGDPDQEWWAQQASWGLMQVMGAVAREHNFHGPYLTAMLRPEVGLEIGCAHLASLLKWSSGRVDSALAAYNGGRAGNEQVPYRNAAYVAKVRRHVGVNV